MNDKTTLLRDADQMFAGLRQAFDGLTEEQMREVWLGTWGVREILIHISGWHQAMIPALQHIARGEEPYPTGTYDDFDAWNARFIAEKAGVKAADVLAELDASHGTFWARPAPFPSNTSSQAALRANCSTVLARRTIESTPPRFESGDGRGPSALTGVATRRYECHRAWASPAACRSACADMTRRGAGHHE